MKASRLKRPAKRTGLLPAMLAFAASPALADLLIENVTLIDGTGRPAKSGMWVLVEDDRITRIDNAAVNAPRSVQRIDGAGQYLIPGLMDLHIHLRGGTEVTPEGLRDIAQNRDEGMRALHSYLYSGVTSIYDAGKRAGFHARPACR